MNIEKLSSKQKLNVNYKIMWEQLKENVKSWNTSTKTGVLLKELFFNLMNEIENHKKQ